MKTLLQLLAAGAVVFSMAACTGGSSGDASNNYPTYTESEVNTDFAGFNAKEKALENSGLKIKESDDYNNGVDTTHYSWDQDFATDFTNNNTGESDADFKKSAVSALQDYISAGQGLIKKYDQPFNLKKDDGSVEQDQMLSDVKSEIKTKMDLANQTLGKMQK